jgi:hypothetical protein
VKIRWAFGDQNVERCGGLRFLLRVVVAFLDLLRNARFEPYQPDGIVPAVEACVIGNVAAMNIRWLLEVVRCP